MTTATREELELRVNHLEGRLQILESRLNSLTQPVGETNVRATLAQALRDIASDIEDDEDLILAARTDPHEDDE